MRKLLLPGLVLIALFAACQTKTPVGPGSVTVVETTSTTSSIPVTTTTTTTSGPSTTTTTVPTGTARRYVAFQAPPNVPADMTLFFELLTAPGTLTSLVSSLPMFAATPTATENEYRVRGVYVMGNGTTGDVNGELGGSSNPLETGGEFEGTLTAKMSDGCVAEREYDGGLTGQTLQWTGGATLRNCTGNPLSFESFTLLKSDAPLPTTTSVTTSSTTSAPSSTTTSVSGCTFTLTPAEGASFASTGGSGQVVIATVAGCAWSAQSFAPWLTVRAPSSGTGPGSITYDVAATTAARQGTIVIAGHAFVVSQSAPPSSTTTSSTPSSSTTTSSAASSSTTTTTPIGTSRARRGA